jgi:hypothetical protein
MRVLNKELNKSNTGVVYPLDIYDYFQKKKRKLMWLEMAREAVFLFVCDPSMNEL